MKLLGSADKLRAMPNMGWMESFSPVQVRLIGLVELAGALGVLLPGLVGIAPWVVPLAASGLALTMLGAYSTHMQRNDPPQARIAPLLLGTMCITVAVGRYWIVPL